MMDFSKAKKILLILSLIYILSVSAIYLIAEDSFNYENGSDDLTAVQAGRTLKVSYEEILGIKLLIDEAFISDSPDSAHLALLDSDGNSAAEAEFRIGEGDSGQVVEVPFSSPLSGHKGKELTLSVTLDGKPQNEIVTSGLYGRNRSNTYGWYWPAAAILFVLLFCLCAAWWKQAEHGAENPLTVFCLTLTKYRFLMKQLILRDFRIKYKRSILGVGWSFFNPLLTMCVQYVVFMTIFGAESKNYPVYLLCGIVFFNFFNESVTLGMNSIIGNASLIKKVYVPKYIYPLTRVLSSLVNLLISMIPLFLIILITGTRFRFSFLLLPYCCFCLTLFVLGMTFLFSTGVTFFQDIAFLWGVISMIWTYATPIFYTETILPEKFRPIFHLNPMYHYITFARTCIIDGVSPQPALFIHCLLSAVIVFVLGILVFKRNEDRFIFYL